MDSPGVLGLLLAVLLVSLVGCARGQQATQAADLTLPEMVNAAMGVLDCSRIQNIHADVYFHDDMKGAYCHSAGSQVIVFLAYASDASVYHAVHEWAATLSSERALIWGDRWLAIGPPVHLGLLGSALGGFERFPSEQPVPSQLTLEQEELTTCMRFASSLTMNKAVDVEAYTRDAKSLNRVYPGILPLIEAHASDSYLEDLKKTWVNDPYAHSSKLSELGKPIKEFCQNWWKAYSTRMNATDGGAWLTNEATHGNPAVQAEYPTYTRR